jgi:methanogenic corrinoid protein MtbC1
MTQGQIEALIPSAGHILPINSDGSTAQVESLLQAAQNFDSAALFRRFRSEVATSGLQSFIQTQADEFLTRVGQYWAAGDLEIEHEHFATEVLRDFLASEWRKLNADCTGPIVVCATPTGELHALGLHLAACCLVLRGYKVVFIGPDSPPTSVAAAANEVGAAAVCLSMSVFSAREDNEQTVERLHQLLPDGTELWLGGGGAEGLVASHTFRDFEAFSEFLGSRLSHMRSGDRQTP